MSNLVALEIDGVMRRTLAEAESQSLPAHEVAIRCLERLRGVGRRHAVRGCSDAEIDAAIARFRAFRPSN